MGDTQITSGSGGIDPLLTPKSPERLLDLLPQDQLPLWLDGKYELRRRIGVGGMGEVYLAFRKDSEVPYAVKLMRVRFPNAAQMEFFFEEARHLRAAAGVGVATVHDWGKAQTSDGPKPYVVLDYYEGAVAPNHPEIVGGCSIEERVRLCAELCGAVARVHEDHAIIHADIKPSNVLVARERDIEGREVRTARLIDFGLARLVREAGGDLSDSKPGGTYRYAAPEILPFGSRSPDERSDQYSLGMTIRAILTGREPEDAEPESHLPDRDRGIDAALRRIIAVATAADPAKRYPRVRDLQRALVGWKGSRIRRARSAMWRGGRRSPFVIAAVIGGVIGLAAYEPLSWLTFDVSPIGTWATTVGLPLPPALAQIEYMRAVIITDDEALREAGVRNVNTTKGQDLSGLRNMFGRAAELLSDSGAAAVAFDVMYESPSSNHDSDAALVAGAQKLLDAGVTSVFGVGTWHLDEQAPSKLFPDVAQLKSTASGSGNRPIEAGLSVEEWPMGPIVHLGVQRGARPAVHGIAAELALRTIHSRQAFDMRFDTASETASYTVAAGAADPASRRSLPVSVIQNNVSYLSMGLERDDVQAMVLTRPGADAGVNNPDVAWSYTRLLGSTSTERQNAFGGRGVIVAWPGGEEAIASPDGAVAGWACHLTAAERIVQTLKGTTLSRPMVPVFARWPGRIGATMVGGMLGALAAAMVRAMVCADEGQRRLSSGRTILLGSVAISALIAGFVLFCGVLVRSYSYFLEPIVPVAAIVVGALVATRLPPARPRPVNSMST